MKARPLIVILITLVIGFVLGMLTSAELRFHRLKPMRIYSSGDRFREGFYKIIQPDKEQKAKIDLILDKYARLNDDLQSSFRKEINTNMEAMRKELDQNLSKEQIARLKEADERRQQMLRQERDKYRNDTTRFHGRFRMNPERPDRHPGSPSYDNPPPPPPYEDNDTNRLSN